ncbi:hypothetical protein [[Lactobacillus] timonensis]|uniref:hypothetical protein n=1 Tax=[Lactobacillus] timonensis TaxID=1970790 RepID=UPI0015E0FF5C|nr:hypothetical protein [[Lactobacillus] timonensis]
MAKQIKSLLEAILVHLFGTSDDFFFLYAKLLLTDYYLSNPSTGVFVSLFFS